MAQQGRPPSETFISVRVVNFGPTANKVGLPQAKKSWFDRKVRRVEAPFAVIIPDYAHSATTTAPKRNGLIEPGDEVSFALPYTEGCFLADKDLVQVGVIDAFGRSHYAPRKQLAELQKRFADDFDVHK